MAIIDLQPYSVCEERDGLTEFLILSDYNV